MVKTLVLNSMIAAIMGGLMSGLITYFLIPLPTQGFENAINNSISGFMSGFMGVAMYLLVGSKR